MAQHTTVGIDLAKQTFYVVALDARGKRQWRKKLTRSSLLRFFARQPACRVAMESCAGAHHWARRLEPQGHETVLLPPQHVKGYRRGQKNDYNDAEAVAEACLHGRIRPVPVKSLEEQDWQSFHRLRKQVVTEQTRLVNQARGLLAEYGVVMAKGKETFGRELPGVLEDAGNGLTPRLREWLARSLARYRALQEEVIWYDQQLKVQVKDDEVCQRLMSIPGFGPVISSVFRDRMGDGRAFRRGREVSAWLGLVPRQSTTGGKVQLLGISKKGDKELRALLVQGARSVVQHAAGKEDELSRWIQRLLERRGSNKTVVAVANKLARIGWVVVVRGEVYRSQTA